MSCSHARASAIVNTEQMGSQPLALALGLAVAAVLSLALTVLSLVRRRRRELALLKALGMTRSQVRAVIAWQTTLTLLIAVAVGGALGIAGGRLAWHAFAGSLGVVPIVEVPGAALDRSAWPRWCWPATCWRRCPRPWPRGPGPGSACGPSKPGN